MKISDIQKALNLHGYGNLTVDNKYGPKTMAALKKFLAAQDLPAPADPVIKSVVEMLLTNDVATPPDAPQRRKVLTESAIIAKYGHPGTSNLVVIDLPYTMVIDWDRAKVTNKIQCHKLIADRLRAALSDLLTHYGLDRIKALELNIYGGCYNFRKMTNGNSFSRHSWGIAIDLNPSKNTYGMTKNMAQFAKPEYAALHQIFYTHGFLNLGLEYGYDFMHMETAE